MDRRSDYHFDLPPAQIAQAPSARRDGSRLLIVSPGDDVTGDDRFDDRVFADIVGLISAHAILVVNDTRVFPARLLTHKPTGGAVELLFLERLAHAHDERWRCLARSSKPIRAGTRLAIKDGDGAWVEVVSPRASDATVTVRVPPMANDSDRRRGDGFTLLERYGEIPLPPYITRHEGASAADINRYQTVYAENRGAVAAPTAGLHFTDTLLDAVRARGVDIARVTLHVGLGTFAPMRVDALDEHVMHTERYTIPDATATLINRAATDGRPVIAVGTTCVRALESAALRADACRRPDAATMRIASGPATTDLFIRPGFQFRVVDQLVTNFHLPESTLLMLVCAFAGYRRMLDAYAHAVAAGYRFFSYGDAMLLSRAEIGT